MGWSAASNLSPAAWQSAEADLTVEWYHGAFAITHEMNSSAQRKLEELRSDYTQVVGKPFRHFFCPILLKDDQAELCKAHIVNQAFRNSNNNWTLQRAGVDDFYGRVFEGDFFDFQYREGAIESFINDPSSAKSMRPELHLRGEKVDYYLTEGPVPAGHSQIVIKGNSAQVTLLSFMIDYHSQCPIIGYTSEPAFDRENRGVS